jgi:hypothetical protein
MLGTMLAAAVSLAQPACPIDRQVYRLQGDARFTAGFARLDPRLPHASKLAFWLKTPKRTYWFSFHAPNGYGGTLIAPDLEPEAALRSLLDEPVEHQDGEEPVMIGFDAFRADLSVYQAPARLFARELGSALWYNATGLAGGEEAEAEAMPISMFEPAECVQPAQPTLQR